MSHRRWLYVALTVLLGVGLAAGVRLLYPPVEVVVMTTGAPGSAYDTFAKQYREILAREGIDLRLEPSAGAVENLRRLNDPSAGVSVGFSQGGLTDAGESPDLVSLGTMFYEPLWFFCRGDGCGERVRDLLGRRVSIGPEGSGTRALAERLLALNGFEDNAVTRLPLSAGDSVDALLRGDIDAAAMVASWSTPAVRTLLASKDVELLDFPRVDAYIALYPYLTKLTVPAGVGNMADNRPPRDVRLLALKASLIVRRDMDPALQYLLLDAATQVHSGADIFRKASQFPAAEAGDLAVSADALQYYKSGRPLLQRYLPFRLSQLASKLLVVLVPLVGLVYPLVRFAPALYGWSMRRRVFRLYGELKLIEADLDAHATDAATLLRRLDHLEERADHLQVPLAFAQTLYHMRSHIGLARARLQPHPGEPPPQAPNGR
ncbi:MAG TPA: TAXI family TRAP transporter solute-binding subunit [Gammaproteobacteria bacterium]|nr:TAXI family TRAP transporter solute-binding subunit [Gammaproteobacteria bacterium]